MPKRISESRESKLLIGDLVYHVLYGRDWLGVLLKNAFDDKYKNSKDPHMISLVKMVPGTKYQFHFKNSLLRWRIDDTMGYISTNWLRKQG